jgi:hypothetical protein
MNSNYFTGGAIITDNYNLFPGLFNNYIYHIVKADAALFAFTRQNENYF